MVRSGSVADLNQPSSEVVRGSRIRAQGLIRASSLRWPLAVVARHRDRQTDEQGLRPLPPRMAIAYSYTKYRQGHGASASQAILARPLATPSPSTRLEQRILRILDVGANDRWRKKLELRYPYLCPFEAMVPFSRLRAGDSMTPGEQVRFGSEADAVARLSALVVNLDLARDDPAGRSVVHGPGATTILIWRGWN